MKQIFYAFLMSMLLSHSFAQENITYDDDIVVGAERIDSYINIIKGKRIAIVGNQTSMVAQTHLVDTLLSLGVDIKKVFAPEHGFRGHADAGAWIKDGRDSKTNLPVVSMYGRNKKPSSEALSDVDIIIFDIQDVGARFYTYISSMHYVMEAAAENNKKVLILDRPNPNGHYVDGPILEEKYKSFIGMHAIPIVHGMTVGEIAKMLNGEKWLGNGEQCDLEVITCENYSHNSFYKVPIKPSPNLPNMSSIYMYPSLCLLEGTDVSVGRGTDKPFQIIGKPGFKSGDYTFTPQSVEGAKNPKYKNVECKGFDLSEFGEKHMRQQRKIYLHWVIDMYNNSDDKADFFKSSGSFNLLCGTRRIREMIEAGNSAEEISATWKEDVDEFKVKRKKYLLYADFE